MICKKCNQQMPELGDFCPFCGEAKEKERLETEETVAVEETATEEVACEEAACEETACEETACEETACEETACQETDAVQAEVPQQKRKLKPWVWVAIIAGGVVLLGVLVLAILYGLGVDLKPKANDIAYKTTYVAEDEDAQKKAEQVVATVGDKELTNSELQLYYQNTIYSFYNQYYYYMSYMGLDLSLPLSEQTCMMAEGQTWEQYFLQSAIESWKNYALLEILAEENGFQLNETLQAELDSIVPDLEAYAVENGYADLNTYIQDNTAINVNVDSYLHFNEAYFVGNEYLNTFYETDYPTQEEIDAYYTENEATFTESGITKDLGLQSAVRHILVSVEGGTEGEDGTIVYSDEDWTAALKEAERILEEWKAGEATEDSFSQLATTYTDDTASAATGGLYEGINVDASYVAAFLEWAIDDTRLPGDTGIVQTEYGYHIMYFVEGEPYWSYIVAEQIISDRIQQVLLAGQEKYPAQVNYKKIVLADTQFM